MGFMTIAVMTQIIDMAIGVFQVGDLFASKISWQASLPKLVLPLNFAFRLEEWEHREN